MPRKPPTAPPQQPEDGLSPEQLHEVREGAKAVALRKKAVDERQRRNMARKRLEGELGKTPLAAKRPGQSKQKTRTLTPEEIKRAHRKDAFIAVLSEGWSVAKACREAGIERKSVYEWRESDPEFKARWDQAIIDGLDSVEDIVLKAGERDWRAGEAILKAKRSETWGNRVKSDVTLNASEGLLAALKAIEGTARGLPIGDDTPDTEG